MRAVRDKGFTLIELLLVISIIAVLIAMTLPTLANARKAAHAVQCGSNLRQMMLAINTYGFDTGVLPYTNSESGEALSNPDRWVGAGWLYRGPIDEGFGLDYDTERREEGAMWDYLRVGDIYHCSLDDALNYPAGDTSFGTRYMTSYVMNRAMNGWNQTLPKRPGHAFEAFRNPANTVVMWEGDETATAPPGIGTPPTGHWNDGNNDPDSQGPSLRHNEAGSVGFLDGHVEAWSWLRYFDVAYGDGPNELYCNPTTPDGRMP